MSREVRIPISRPYSADERNADVEVGHPLGDLADRVLGSDDERAGCHDLTDPRDRPLVQSVLDGGCDHSVAALLDGVRVELDLDRHARPRGRLGRGLRTCQLRQKRSEVPADDLRRRPPQWLGGDLAGPALQLAVEVVRPVAGQQQTAEHRPERSRLEVDTGRRGDRLGGCLRLLRRDAALLDGERRDVAGRRRRPTSP